MFSREKVFARYMEKHTCQCFYKKKYNLVVVYKSEFYTPQSLHCFVAQYDTYEYMLSILDTFFTLCKKNIQMIQIIDVENNITYGSLCGKDLLNFGKFVQKEVVKYLRDNTAVNYDASDVNAL